MPAEEKTEESALIDDIIEKIKSDASVIKKVRSEVDQDDKTMAAKITDFFTPPAKAIKPKVVSGQLTHDQKRELQQILKALGNEI